MPVKRRRTAGLGLGARDLVAADLATFLLLLFLLVFLLVLLLLLFFQVRALLVIALAEPLGGWTA